MEDNWDTSLIEVLNSLSKLKPHNVFTVGSNLSDIILLKFRKKNVNIKDIDELLCLMENLIHKVDPKIFEVINYVGDNYIIEENDIILKSEKYQRWINFRKICKICKNNRNNLVIL
tara:strand:- start:98 stop:445 length:348 start_codon:yes stop_codon:yes gene_type:complete